MRTVPVTATLAALTAMAALTFCAESLGAAPATVEAKAKNWTPPEGKIYAQSLADQIMAQHPELLSVTLHGEPPGRPGVYTMFAGSYPERIGNPDDPDDIDVITKGITLIDPRWHRTNDTRKKFVVQMPLRNASGENVGLLVLAYHNDRSTANTGAVEVGFLRRAVAIRDALQNKIPDYAALFAPAASHTSPSQPSK